MISLNLGENRVRWRALPRKSSPMWRTIHHEVRRWAKISGSRTDSRKTEITLETERIWIIRKSRTRRGWCAECGREVDLVQLKEAEILSGKDVQPPKPIQCSPAAGTAGGGIGRKARIGRR
jgi:hypothetical protein